MIVVVHKVQQSMIMYQSVDDACKLVKEGFYMAKVDLKWAYRSINISIYSQLFTGLKWQFQGKTK